MQNGILSGIRVIDCGTYIAGPASATVMSDFGAEVFKIENPDGGDLWRLFPHLPGTPKSKLNYAWVLTGRNKKSVALDLGSPEGYDALIRLVKTADVFVTNYQAQLLTKFRLNWDDLRAVNDRLIFAHLTGYGEKGDDADLPAFDALAYWARSGLMTSVTGRDGTPSGPRPGIGDHPTATALFSAIMLGLYDRERTGRGAKVSTSLMASGAWAHGCDLQAKMFGAEFPQLRGPHPINPLSSGYITRDGKLFLLVQLDPEHEFPRLCTMLGAPDLATRAEYATAPARSKNRDALNAEISAFTEKKSTDTWVSELNAAGVPCGPIYSIDQVFEDAQVKHLGIAQDVPNTENRHIRLVGQPVTLSRTPSKMAARPPEFGEQTDEVLSEFGFGSEEIADLRLRKVV